MQRAQGVDLAGNLGGADPPRLKRRKYLCESTCPKTFRPVENKTLLEGLEQTTGPDSGLLLTCHVMVEGKGGVYCQKDLHHWSSYLNHLTSPEDNSVSEGG